MKKQLYRDNFIAYKNAVTEQIEDVEGINNSLNINVTNDSLIVELNPIETPLTIFVTLVTSGDIATSGSIYSAKSLGCIKQTVKNITGNETLYVVSDYKYEHDSVIPSSIVQNVV